MEEDDNKVRILGLKLNRKSGGQVTMYAEVDAETFQRWLGYFRANDTESILREAPKVLWIRLSEEAAQKRMKDMDGASDVESFAFHFIPGVFAEDVLP